jgi:hypothetical protein
LKKKREKGRKKKRKNKDLAGSEVSHFKKAECFLNISFTTCLALIVRRRENSVFTF